MHVVVVQEVDVPGEGAGRQGAVLRIRGATSVRDHVAGAEGGAIGWRSIVALGTLPTLIVSGVEIELFTPSDTVSRTTYWPGFV